MTKLSVIIPLAPGETAWKSLLSNLNLLSDNIEILLVTSEKPQILHEISLLSQKTIKVLASEPSRAKQMNAGAMEAKGKYLWFLHADSKFGRKTLPALMCAIKKYPYSLLYFDLSFLNDATFFMFLNQWGVYFRSHVFKMPFGDQGFCIQKDLFNHLKGFREDLPYGEDHIFVWRAHQQGVSVQSVGATLYTSARKYKKHGWLKTTLIHQYLWLKQALPEWKKLKRSQ